MATIIISLNTEEYDGGETVFPKLNLKLKPTNGSAIVMYNFGPGWGGRKCNPNTQHRSDTVVRGRKLVLQRWYTYPIDPCESEFRIPLFFLFLVWSITHLLTQLLPKRAQTNLRARAPSLSLVDPFCHLLFFTLRTAAM
jgi:hypothetical protein